MITSLADDAPKQDKWHYKHRHNDATTFQTVQQCTNLWYFGPVLSTVWHLGTHMMYQSVHWLQHTVSINLSYHPATLTTIMSQSLTHISDKDYCRLENVNCYTDMTQSLIADMLSSWITHLWLEDHWQHCHKVTLSKLYRHIHRCDRTCDSTTKHILPTQLKQPWNITKTSIPCVWTM